MALGQTAGTVVVLLLEEGGESAVHGLDVATLEDELFNKNAVSVYISGWENPSKGERIKRQKDILGAGTSAE